ncbi:MAG: fumarate hydratase [Deltaproteobacteria bacterium]|nr:fumarate hydratase [Deltaproteobacteria bacterium]
MEFAYEETLQLGKDGTHYRKLTSDHVSVGSFDGQEVLKVAPEGLTLLAHEAFRDISFLLRASHHEKLAQILKDPEASDNDKAVARVMLENAVVAAEFQLPFCQDTGTATIVGKKGNRVFTDGRDAEHLSLGVYQTYTEENLRYSQTVPLTMYDEKNSGNNLPAQIDIYATEGMDYRFLFVAKGGGSANKAMLFQETKAVLNPKSLEAFLVDKIRHLGTAACPPYHLAVVVGGTSAESVMKTVKLASTGYLDHLPTSGTMGGRAFRDVELEGRLLEASRQLGYGAQFGGKYFCHDVRVVRMPRHGASCPVGIALSCSADRNAKAKITSEGIYLEDLERNPGRFLAGMPRGGFEDKAIKLDLDRPMKEILADLSRYPVKTLLSLTGRLVVGRDIAHAKLKERVDAGQGLPEYLKKHPIYYAGPAKTPAGMPSGSFGPTTAGRMDSYVDLFQSLGGSLIMIAKGNRSQQVTDACKKHGGFYLASIGGPAAILARHHIKKVEVLEYPELGMEAIWAIDVEGFPAMIVVDDKGNDFFNLL